RPTGKMPVPHENVAAGPRTGRGTPPGVPTTDDQPTSLTRAYLTGATAIPIPSNRRPVEEWQDTATRANDEQPARGKKTTRTRGAARAEARGSSAGASSNAPNSELATRYSELATNSWLVVRGARQNNLKNLTVPIPLGRFTCVTGVSGSGKSSLVNDILWPALARDLQRSTLSAGEHDTIDGVDQLDKVINVNQSPIGSTPASNPATYTGVFDWIRELFTRLPDSKMRGYNGNRFSFNRPGGRCDACQGYGRKCIEMHFMPDVWVECETCRGRRYNPETLEIRFKSKNIADVLEMSVAEALKLFENVPKVRRMLQTLSDVGLDYVQLGQPAPTLSGGEAQRVKLAAELGKPNTGRTFYILDEPTTGLHFDDIRKLLAVIHRLADLGNTVLVVEHNLDVLKCADWIIDLGPEAGDAGGYLVAMGTPENIEYRIQNTEYREENIEYRIQNTGEVARDRTHGDARGKPERSCKTAKRQDRAVFSILYSVFSSHTAAALRPILAAGPYEERQPYDPAAHAAREMAAEKAGYGDVGKDTRMPWQVDGRKWHLEQRSSRNATPTRWEAEALDYVLELVHKAGRGAFAETNWNNRASVEVTAPGAKTWFMHALTGGEWLLDLYFLVPPKTFKWLELDAQLGLKTLDEREDLQTYGDWSRVDVRPRKIGKEAVMVCVHDKKEIDTPGFRKFVKAAVKAYLAAL
ncbi:MAG: excinuclease ABC subunit A, partial [Phycisphaerae bacterium]|nr:excinuclease ABC subunit A [Phycisphaerae bacterium]